MHHFYLDKLYIKLKEILISTIWEYQPLSRLQQWWEKKHRKNVLFVEILRTYLSVRLRVNKIIFKSYCILKTFTAFPKHETRTQTFTVAHPRCAGIASPGFHRMSSWARGRSGRFSRGPPPGGSPSSRGGYAVGVSGGSRSRPVSGCGLWPTTWS